MITIVVNPKEYFEKHKNENVNKKQKGIRKGAAEMNFESYVCRVLSLNSNDDLKNLKKNTHKCFQVKNDMRKMTSTKKSNLQD